MDTLAWNHPVIFVLILTIAWLVLLMVLMGIVSSAFRKPYGDAKIGAMARLAVTACLLWLAWRLGWQEASGIARLGSWQAWLLALAGLVYFASASLYAIYGKAGFNFSSLRHPPDSRATVIAHFAVGLSEEVLFRGLVLYVLSRVWGNTVQGIIASVVLTALLFAVLHITQVFTHAASRSATLLLTLETFIIAIWWGALAVFGGSIWPVVVLHILVNAVVAVQGLKAPMVEPSSLAYRRIMWFSILLGVLGIGLLM